MKMRFLLLLTALFMFGVVSSYGCLPGERHVYTVKDKKTKKGWLGVNLEDVTRRLAERKSLVTTSGAYVTSVVDDSPAEDAGIRKGDVIIKFDGREVDGSDDLTDMVRGTKPGSTVDIVVERSKERKTLKAEIDRLRETGFSFNFNDDDDDTYFFGTPTPPRAPRATTIPRVQVFTSGSALYGLSVQSLSKQLAEYFQVPGKKGALVNEVKKGSTAEKAGFKAGDVITKVGSVSVWDVNDVTEELRSADDGDELNVEVIRKGSPTTLKMKIDEDDEWSYHYVPGGSGYHFYHDGDHSLLDKTEWSKAKREMRDALRESLGETKRELKKAKEELKRELLKM